MRAWFDGYDFNLPLVDVANDPDLDERRRMLAAAGLREGLDGGYYEAQALAEAVLALAMAENGGGLAAEARASATLDGLLGADEAGYQRALHALVADLPAADAAAHLSWVARQMGARADMCRVVKASGTAILLPGR
jgi:hypothetical protein